MRAALCLVALSLVSAGSWAQSDGPLFPRLIVTARPSHRSGLHAVDVNADGHPDLITANGNSTGVLTVNLGDGRGFFSEKQETWVGGDPRGIAAGDVDGDGLEELAVSCSVPQQVQIAHSVGDGTFTVGQSIGVGQNPRELVLEDLDGDGDLDLAVVRATAGGLVVALGDGSGAFGPTTTYATAATSAEDLAAADLDQDGDTDLVVAFGVFTGLQILWNDGAGGFVGVAPMLTATIMADVLVADVTGDQVVDLVGAGGGFVRLFVGQGGGSFAPVQSWGESFGGLGSAVHSLAAADIDGDADVDIAVSVPNSELVALLMNDGASTAGLLTTPAGEQNGPVVLADVDGDGLVDLLAGGSASDNTDVTVVLNTLDPLFEMPIEAPTPTITEQAMARGDVDGNGTQDIVLFGRVDGDTTAVAALENESFALIAQAVVNVSNTNASSVWSGDLNGDGRDDVVVPDSSADTLAILHGQAGGSFGPQLTIPTSIDPTFVTGADLDGDGDCDLVTAHRDQATVGVLWNDGLPGFSPPLLLASATRPERVLVGDVDEDGFRDLVVLHPFIPALSLYRGLGGHAFAAPLSIAVGNSPDDIELTDLDQDGDLDLVVTESDALRVLLGDGSGAFATSATYAFDGTRYLSAGDLDGDGLLDLLASGLTLIVFLGHGDGSFTHAGDFDGQGAPDDLLLDANGDGTLDLLVASGGLPIHWNAADEQGPLEKVGPGLAGSNGTPHWSGLGTLQPLAPLALSLAHAKPGAPLTLVLGFSLLEAPFKGGTMVPLPQLLLAGLSSNATGALALSTSWPAGIPSGFLLATQCWIVDPAGPAGLAASNGLVLTTP